MQLRERGRYLYKIEGERGLTLCEERGVTTSPAGDGGGLIEPGDQCGVLPLTLMRGNEVVARGAVKVRLIKLGYREHYRGMLSYIAEKCAGLLLDSRAATRRTDFLDTAENRFVKMVLVQFRDFLAEVAVMLGRDAADAVKTDNVRLLREVARLGGRLDALLGRGFLPDVSRPELLPLGSPVLKRKAG